MSVKDFTRNLDSLLIGFEERLREVIRSEVEFIQLIEDDLVTAGGKRVRPRLALLAAGAVGNPDDASAINLALAVELIHSAALLHDDLIDNAETRRLLEPAGLVLPDLADYLPRVIAYYAAHRPVRGEK
jgi:octaprenyl-diphosphate synthase